MRNRLLDLVLLPAALVVVVLEDVVWAGARALLRALNRLPPVRRLDGMLRGLPGWVALPLFLALEALGKLGELWAVGLLVEGRIKSAALAYLSVRIVATIAAVFVYHACEPALLRYAWFAAVLGWIRRVRDWALAMIAPWRDWLRGMLGRTRSRLSRRFAAIRRAWAVRRFGAPDR